MKPLHLTFRRVALTVIGLTVMMTGQQAPQQGVGYVDDWTHHHLVFSNPGTAADALRNGTLEQWYKINNDPRYRLQQLKRSAVNRALAAAPDFAARQAIMDTASRKPIPTPTPIPVKGNPIKKDWSQTLDGSYATQTGTVLSNGAASGSTISVNSKTISASVPGTASATLTVGSLPTSTSDTVTVTNSSNSNTFVLTENGAAASATGNFLNVPTSQTLATMSVGPNSFTLATTATAGSYGFTLGNGSLSKTTGSITYTYTGPNPVTIKITGATSASSCTLSSGTYSGNFAESSSNQSSSYTAANNFLSELNACLTAAGITSSTLTASTSSGEVLLTDVYLGNFLTVSSNLTHTTVNVNSTGSNGTAATCGASSPYTVDYVVSTTSANMASSLYNELYACPTAADIATSYTSGSSFGITAIVLGSGTFSSSNTSVFTFSSMSTGSNGSNACTSSTAGTFGTGSSPSAVASAIAGAITNCSSANQAVIGINNAPSTNGSGGVTIYAYAPGSTGNNVTVSAAAGFTTGGGSLTGGSDGTTGSGSFAYWSGNAAVSPTQLASNLATAITDTSGTNVNATSSGNVVTVTASSSGMGQDTLALSSSLTGFAWGGSDLGGNTVQPNAYPAKFSFSTSSASCTQDFVVYPTGKAGSSNAASIIAYSNLYSGCTTGTVPSVYWAYDTGGTVTTSPILSYWDNGAQLAFIQVSGTTASLVLIKWASSTTETATSPLTLTNQASGSAYRSCTPTASAPCMYTIPFGNGANDTYSAPFYDYGDDVLYVGDDSGNLHKFASLFGLNSGTSPAENTTSPWPVNLGSAKLASPLYDPNTPGVPGGQVFVGDLGGALHCVTPAGAIFDYNSLTLPTGLGAIADAPLIDSGSNCVLAFTATDTVYDFSEQYFPGGQGSAGAGTGGTGYYLYAGTFDNVYYQSSNRTGNLYVLGNTVGSTGNYGAALYRLGLSAGLLIGGASDTAVVTGLTPNTSGVYPWPSPVTEFCNGACTSDGTKTTAGTDYVFFSLNRASVGSCTNTAGNGCILSYNVSNPLGVVISGTGLKVTTPGTSGCWATGGIVVDNSSTTAGASEIYVVNLNGAAAGGPTGTAQTSTSCTAGTTTSLNGVQASQSSP